MLGEYVHTHTQMEPLIAGACKNGKMQSVESEKQPFCKSTHHLNEILGREGVQWRVAEEIAGKKSLLGNCKGLRIVEGVGRGLSRREAGRGMLGGSNPFGGIPLQELGLQACLPLGRCAASRMCVHNTSFLHNTTNLGELLQRRRVYRSVDLLSSFLPSQKVLTA